jgi:glycerate-2-kinase
MKQNVAFLSCGTDGIDGPTDAAGAVVDQNTIEHANKKGMNAEHFIERNDSYHFFEKAGGHVITGPTGNNVMDIQIVLID